MVCGVVWCDGYIWCVVFSGVMVTYGGVVSYGVMDTYGGVVSCDVMVTYGVWCCLV